ncbi:dehydrodolichyl diphosphate synthase complex subunit DHDDS-like [Centruroides sculpturatus]|uniref:dehydrodolichyl diphosphate synthase complex subunit DHDDS-like n=1 Tax=Centruroides sculpturatus TaxID=218467 RepID=UPI000C6EDEF2|nr:dehydrodolichyl diphosphate synthase complex subunit DHDDS-like [Centruroides sculpturatus]
MVWLEKVQRTWLESFVIKVLQTGDIPKHVAFIMDGNRRYADKLNLNRVDGHTHGFKKLSEVNIKVLMYFRNENSIWSHSCINDKTLMQKDDCSGISTHGRSSREKIDKYGICVRVLGDINLLPNDIQKAIADVVLYSMHNNSLFINVCLAYTSQEEISTAANEIAEAVSDGILKPEDVDEELLDQCMYNSSEPDLLVRTSGEVRLSDFLLWQSSYSLLTFVKVLWPEYSIWHLFASIWSYQHSLKYIKAGREKHFEARKQQTEREIYRHAISALRDEELTEEKLQDYILKRKERINNFLCHLKHKRIRKLEEIKKNGEVNDDF